MTHVTHIWMRHVTQMNASSHTHLIVYVRWLFFSIRVIPTWMVVPFLFENFGVGRIPVYSYVWHDSFMCVKWLIHICNMIHSHTSGIIAGVTWLIQRVTRLISYEWHDFWIHVTRLTSYDMIHFYVWCVLWLISMCDMNDLCMWYESLTYVARIMHLCNMSHSYVCVMCHSCVWRDSFICVVWYALLICVTLVNRICEMTLFIRAIPTYCNTLQHTATHCNTLQHTATHCNTLQHTATHCNTLQHATPSLAERDLQR